MIYTDIDTGEVKDLRVWPLASLGIQIGRIGWPEFEYILAIIIQAIED